MVIQNVWVLLKYLVSVGRPIIVKIVRPLLKRISRKRSESLRRRRGRRRVLRKIHNKIFFVKSKDKNVFFTGYHSYEIYNCLFVMFARKGGISFDAEEISSRTISINYCMFENTCKLKERWGLIAAWEANGGTVGDLDLFKSTKEELIEDKIANKDW